MGTLWNLQSYSRGFALYSALPMAYGTAYYAISPAANMLLTILITARLLFYRQRAKKYLRWEQISEYFSLSTILIESAALNSVFAIVFVITFAIDHSLNQVFLGVASSAQVSWRRPFENLADVPCTANRWIPNHLSHRSGSRMEQHYARVRGKRVNITAI